VDIKKLPTYKRKRFWAGILLAQILLFFILSKIKFAVSLFEKFFEFQKEFHQKLFSNLSFSVGDFLYFLLGIILLFFLLKIIKKSSRHKYLIKLFTGANIFYFVYQIFWGMLYFQAPLKNQFSKDEVRKEEVKALAVKYLNLCKESRLLIKENSGGVFQVQNLAEIKAEIIRNQNKLPVFLPSKKGFKISSAKPSLFNQIMSYSGILGYYNPFTAETQYNPNLPSTYIPFTLAHEYSHQLGYAREQEANFIGYLSGKNSQNVELRYSTEYFVLKSLLNSLVEKDPKFVHATISQYSAGMKRDRFAEKFFNKKHQGYFNSLFGITNDLFLKSNQQDGSITYSYFVELLVRFEYQN
jgi:hypothetical protein